MSAAGQGTTSAVTGLVEEQFCDVFFDLAAALAHRTSITTTTLAAGQVALGSSFSSADTFRTDFVDGRPDGAAAYRDLGYELGCHCFAYTSGEHTA